MEVWPFSRLTEQPAKESESGTFDLLVRLFFVLFFFMNGTHVATVSQPKKTTTTTTATQLKHVK